MSKTSKSLEKGSQINPNGTMVCVFLGDLPPTNPHMSKLSSQWTHQDKAAYKMIMENVVALLNNRGGKLYFGVSRKGIVEGCTVNRDAIDLYQLITDDVFSKIQPIVPRAKYRVEFLPVTINRRESRFYVICIKVESGDKNEVYADTSRPMHAVFVRHQGAVTRPLSPHEIGKLALDRYKTFLNGGGKIHALVKSASSDLGRENCEPPAKRAKPSTSTTASQPSSSTSSASSSTASTSSTTTSKSSSSTSNTAGARTTATAAAFNRVKLRKPSKISTIPELIVIDEEE